MSFQNCDIFKLIAPSQYKAQVCNISRTDFNFCISVYQGDASCAGANLTFTVSCLFLRGRDLDENYDIRIVNYK